MLSRDVRRIQTRKGRYKVYHMPMFYRVAPWVRWHAVGDASDVRELLSDVQAIGKKRKHGWGWVTRWEVREGDADRSVVVDGVPQRSVPVTERTGQLVAPAARRMLWGYYPPYYVSRNQTECFMPEQIRLGEPGV